MDTEVKCLSMVGDVFKGTYYQQFTMRASTPDCSWMYTFQTADTANEDTMTFHFLVNPVREPPVEGTLYVLNDIDWVATPTPTYEVNAGDLLTIRVLADPLNGGFKWNKPAADFTWACFELV
jgi:hypothetical protein